ncbi:TPA: hypothetical protein ACGIDN_004812, partial [Salmonella enterica subsp. enterica serovar Typhimurium]
AMGWKPNFDYKKGIEELLKRL